MTLSGRLAALRDRDLRLYVVATGAGAGIQKALWEIPGASSYLVGASFPYAAGETDEFLGFRPEKYASSATALDLAMEAWRRAFRGGAGRGAIGLGVTASVASLREHRGEHRVHVAVVTTDRVLAADEILPRGAGTEARLADGARVDDLALRTLLAAIEPDGTTQDAGPWRRADREAREQFFAHPAISHRRRTTEREVLANPTRPIFPGAFDPPHAAHRAIAVEAGGSLFTICARSPHKGTLTLQQMLARAAQFRDGEDVLFTDDDPLYLDKARRFPGHPIVLGADALVRMLDPAWGPDIEGMLAELDRLETRFLVFGRALDGAFLAADEVIGRVPAPWRHAFTAMKGRWDLSSSEIRHPVGSATTRGAKALEAIGS